MQTSRDADHTVARRPLPGFRQGFLTLLAAAFATALVLAIGPDRARSSPLEPCEAPVENVVACENSLPGNPKSEWDITGAGDESIQGYATPFSVDHGQTVHFKVKTDATDYRIDVYRLGYYGGLGARKVATLAPTAALPQEQPECMSDASTGLVDCGNWAESASFAVPATAVSGVYIAKLVRPDTNDESHIHFVVRDDARHSELLFQTSDTTWQAYNRYGGNSLYFGSPVGRAYKVSYNRPFTTRSHTNTSFFFNGEYPLLRWFERNGYDVSYFSGIDTARRGAEILEHETFISAGHDEYWSADQRANVEAARDTGVNLAFFSGNEVFWKTRWEPSIDGSATPFTTLVSYKETHAGAKIDPTETWTGTWRDARFSPPADGGRPENALTGTLFKVNSYREDALRVPAVYAGLRFWRNTSVALLTTGQTATFPLGILGHEWDEDIDNGSRPPGLLDMSLTTLSVSTRLSDEGNTFGAGTARHSLTLYRAASGALVFGAGTVQWGWGLDNVHDVFNANPPRPPDVRMQQATVNVLADMEAQPYTLQSGLVAATASADTEAPASTITSPASGTIVASGTVVTISGTASDTGGGQVAAVEVTTDGGETWHPATGRSTWTYAWTAGGDADASVRSRAVDDSGNLEVPQPGILIEVHCPCRLWPSSTIPATTATTDAQPVELGVKFRADVDGWLTGIRFYKGAGNSGTHTGSLWTASGTLMSRATFTTETATGWQEVQLDAPVPVTAGTLYVASYHAPAGRYARNGSYFASATYVNVPLRAPSNGSVGGNGVYAYGSAIAFPNESHAASNYWVDVVYYDQLPVDTRRPRVVVMQPASGSSTADASGTIEATFSEAMNAATVSGTSFILRTAAGVLVPATVSYDAVARKATLTPNDALGYETAYIATVKSGTTGAKDVSGNTLDRETSWPFTTGPLRPCPCSLWTPSMVPAVAATSDSQAVELGMKFRADVPGWITGIRFYKGAGNTGTHVGSLWTVDGTLLGRATFAGESSTGWQEVLFDGPLPIAVDTTYVVSYHAPNGHYSLNSGAFGPAGFTHAPLRALRSGADGGNGVFRYSGTPAYPDDTFGSGNYWVDVVYHATQPSDSTPPQVTVTTPAEGETADVTSVVSATFSERLDPASINGDTFSLRAPGGAVVAATVTYDVVSRKATLQPTAELDLSTTYQAELRGGLTGIKDVAGNALAADVTWPVSTKTCPCTIWSASATPAVAAAPDGNSVEVGVKFRTDRAGWIDGIRFYKGSGNTGTHVGSLWTAGGLLLARATFTSETASGWQEVTFGGPVAVAEDTTYVASYHAPNGHYALTSGMFSSAGQANTPLKALQNGEDGPNGVYLYGASPVFPTDSWGASNYWVDVTYSPTRPTDETPPSVSSVTPAAGTNDVAVSTVVRVTFTEAIDSATVTPATFVLRDGGGQSVPSSLAYDATTRTVTLTPSEQLGYGTQYLVVVDGGPGGVADEAGNTLPSDSSTSFATRACPCSLWGDSFTPAVASSSDTASVELGVRFQADIAGTITGIRFYKGAANTGVHLGSLWSADGTLLARTTFTSETASGWQLALFATPVQIAAGTSYIASYYAPNGGYAVNTSYFNGAAFVQPPVRAETTSGLGNGLYLYSAFPSFPTETWASSNYWVDVSFQPA